MKRTLMILALGLAIVSPLAAQEEPALEETIEVNVVQLDVTVTDKKGNQILGLEPGDFIVKEDGKEITVDSLDYFTNRILLDTPEDQAEFKVERVHDERYFIIMFHTLPDPRFRATFQSDMQLARRASLDFVKNQIRDEDRVAIIAFDIRLKIFSDFTSDRMALVKAIDEAITFSNGISTMPEEPVENGIFANLNMQEVINRTGRIYSAVEMIADAVDPIPARKVLLLFSPGIGQASSFSDEIKQNDLVWFNPMMEAIQRANVTVYPMHLLRTARYHAGEQNLVQMAAETGGDYYRQASSFEMPLKLIENENNGYYMLTYYADPGRPDDMVKISVTLRNSEFKVKTRKGR